MNAKAIGPVAWRRGTTAKVNQYIGKSGEIVVDMEAKTLRIHDGITQGGHEVGAAGASLLIWDDAVSDNLGAHNETATVSVSVKALSAFGDEQVTYRVTAGALPNGLAINAQGMLTGRMPNLQATTPYTFRVEATDGVGTINREFTITVNAVNDSPVWQTASDLGRLTGAANIQLTATDPDSSPLTYSITGGSLPLGLSMSAHGKITGTPTINGNTYNFTVQVSDGVNNVSRTFSIVAAIGPGTIVDGDIVAGQMPDGSWLLVANAMKRAQKRWGLYETDTTLVNISPSASDPRTGKQNTDVLVSAQYASVNDGYVTGAPAAKFCRDQGYDLPSREELNLIHQNRSAIDAADNSGGTAKLAYIAAHSASSGSAWASTEHDASLAWSQRFSGGSFAALKNNEFWAIPARRVQSL